ncbi:NHLP leader peptide family RiPP precursor [Floridanema aerugineum]|uniref:NHLP leader peptide family RiPP n=1 Tax=Floridaenema aerugineum BLCC-F46 TaxID=3153654 RepID=A0ABV4X0P3_9CYAN
MVEIKAQLIKLALQDSEFRNRLIVDPKGAIAKAGLDVPTETQITVMKETPNHHYLVLPPLELLEGKLEEDFSHEQLKINEEVQTPASFSSTDPTGHILETQVQLLTRILRDSEFRNRLIADPKGVMAEKGLNVPADVQVTVLQETPSHYYLVLPAFDFPELEAGRELSDEELEFVAGGMSNEAFDLLMSTVSLASDIAAVANPFTAIPAFYCMVYDVGERVAHWKNAQTPK